MSSAHNNKQLHGNAQLAAISKIIIILLYLLDLVQM